MLAEHIHTIQVDVFNAMHARGFYPTPPAEQQKFDQAKQKFVACAIAQNEMSHTLLVGDISFLYH